MMVSLKPICLKENKISKKINKYRLLGSKLEPKMAILLTLS